ncbi:hypothetical protein EV174_000428 [Coemansia sp. RSA 2320]|nr:hypothetical protein EV174_000428 [Coemansia sp. RSA 2320]
MRRNTPAVAEQAVSAQTPLVHAASIDPTVATQTALQIGDLAKHGLDTYLPTRIVEYALEYTHVMTGLPWWATIAVLVVGVRVALFPVAAWSHRHQVRVNQVQPELKVLTAKQQVAGANGDVMTSARMMQEIKSFYKQHDVHPFKAMVGNLTTIPFMMGMFFGLRDMATLSFTHMSSGGLWWFTDLAAADPTYVLPVISCVGMMGVMELQTRLTSAVPPTQQMKMLMRIGSVVMVFLTSGLPASVFVFWVINNLCSLAQVLLFHSRPFRRVAGIPDIVPAKYARPPETALSKLNIKALLTKEKPTKFVVKRKL